MTIIDQYEAPPKGFSALLFSEMTEAQEKESFTIWSYLFKKVDGTKWIVGARWLVRSV